MKFLRLLLVVGIIFCLGSSVSSFAANKEEFGGKIRAKDGEIKVLLDHPMETGLRKDSKGEKIPADYIKEMTVTLNGKVIFSAKTGAGISRNPFIHIIPKSMKPGDLVKLSWVDMTGRKGEVSQTAE